MSSSNDNGICYIKFLAKDDEWFSSSYFNENAYPDGVKKLAHSCWRRFSLIFTYYRNIPIQISHDMKFLLMNLNTRIAGEVVFPSGLDYEISFESMAHVSNLNGILFTTKSFLDIWAKTCAKIFDPKSKLRGFGKGNIEGQQIAGGKFINWLRESIPSSTNAPKLSDLTQNHSQNWIDDLVKYRDTLIHYGEIGSLKPLRIIIRGKPKQSYKEKDLIQASMPNDVSIIDYCKMIIINLNNYVIDCINLLPNIQLKYLNLKTFIFKNYTLSFPNKINKGD